MSTNRNISLDYSPWSGEGSRQNFRGRRGMLVVLSLVVFLMPELLEAQCAMCRAALESEADNSQAEGINNGIVYLMAVPYILVGGLFYLIYRKIKS